MSRPPAPTPPVREVALIESSALVGLQAAARLAVPYADTRADELSHALDLPRQPALRSLAVELGGLGVELRILGYSHQVVVAGGTGDTLLTETIARLSGPSGAATRRALPDSHEEWRESGRPGRLRYVMTATVTRLSEHAGLEALMLDVDRSEHAILGVFPGHPHAFTGLVAAVDPPSGAQWRSWHAYPATDELVSTHSRLLRETT